MELVIEASSFQYIYPSSFSPFHFFINMIIHSEFRPETSFLHIPDCCGVITLWANAFPSPQPPSIPIAVDYPLQIRNKCE